MTRSFCFLPVTCIIMDFTRVLASRGHPPPHVLTWNYIQLSLQSPSMPVYIKSKYLCIQRFILQKTAATSICTLRWSCKRWLHCTKTCEEGCSTKRFDKAVTANDQQTTQPTAEGLRFTGGKLLFSRVITSHEYIPWVLTSGMLVFISIWSQAAWYLTTCLISATPKQATHHVFKLLYY